jgi:hypothetical protein
MKKVFFLAAIASLGFIACDTPSPATTSPNDSTGTQGTTPMTDTAGRTTDTTRTDSTRF